MVTPDYHFGTTSGLQTQDGGPGNAVLVESTFTASRQEGDFTIGYFPLDWLGVAIGYKGIFQDLDVKGRATRFGNPVPQELQPVPTQKVKFNGLTFGVLGSA